MKKLSGVLAVFILATRLLAQSNEPVRLALIAETGEASTALDVLTAQLSDNPKLHLLERNEIEKIYREQALSAGNTDYLKLGRILGADGLLLFQSAADSTSQSPTAHPAQEDWQVMSNRWSSVPLAQLRQAAERGDLSAQYYLGRACLYGYGIARDQNEGLKWIKHAADQGSANAQGHLGWMYDKGVGVPQDYAEAAKFYRLAADQGHARAQNNLGYLYQKGLGVRRDPDEAVKWYRRAADQGDNLGQGNLAWMYENGYEGENSYESPQKTARPGSPQQANLTVRLIAVKPGVVLMAENITWPSKGAAEWAPLFEKRLNPFLPKLSVLPKDAIPISVVNLRSAVQSADAQETERQLKLLTIQRLSQERQFFVLERQRMQLLGEEKELKADESAFWNGSYLLEGVVDQNGYSKETITINARLTPKGGAPLLIEVSGSRTNFAEVINQLAAKVIGLLKVSPTVKEWNAADEAQQYYDEAKWALKWGVLAEAQAAADSAWALGMHDETCATVRIKAYANSTGRIIIEGGGMDRSTVDSSEESDRDWVVRDIKRNSDTHPGAVFAFSAEGINSVLIDNSPDPQSLDHAIRALEFYREFSQTLLPDEPKVDSAWYGLGVESLTAASQVLQHFYLVPKSQKPAAEKLAQLRALARSVAEWISKSPSVHDSYFANRDPDAGWRLATSRFIPNIFRCKATVGCFWQEKPEDCVVLYRELMSSSLFSGLKEEFWSRGPENPRLTAWNEEDRKRIPEVWDNFVGEQGRDFVNLNATGVNGTEMIAQYREYWQDIQTAKHNLMPLGKQKESEDLISMVFYFLQVDEASKRASEIKPLLVAYRSNLVTLREVRSGVARFNLTKAIEWVDYVQSKVEKDLKPGQAKVETGNVVSRPSGVPPAETKPKSFEIAPETVTNILFVKKHFEIPKERIPKEEQFYEEKMAKLRIVGHHWGEGRLVLDLRYDCEMHVNGGGGWRTKALAAIFSPANGSWEIITYPPAGNDRGYPVWPSGAVSLEIFQGGLYLVQDEQSILEGNRVGHSGRILKYDFKARRWEELKIPEQGVFEQTLVGQGFFQLFVVNDRLFAANYESIFEITDDGHGTHILAGTRRRPAVSALDLLDNLGSPILYSGLNNSLHAIIGNNIYVWDEKDWEKEIELGFDSQREVFEGAILFQAVITLPREKLQALWILQKGQTGPELCLYEKPKPYLHSLAQGQKLVEQTPNPLWKLPEGDSFADSAATFFKSNLYLYIDHAIVTNVSNRWMVAENDGYHAKLICLSRDLHEPIVVPLKFDLERGRPPLKSLGQGHFLLPWEKACSTWMHFAGDTLYISQPDTPGIWGIPVSEVEAAVTAQKALLLKKAAQVSNKTQNGKTP